MSALAQENLVVFGSPVDEASLEQIKNVLAQPGAVKGALMADHHRGYSLPIGGVVAFQDQISPNGVGFDIACGNLAVRTNIHAQDLTRFETEKAEGLGIPAAEVAIASVKPIMRDIQKRISFGAGRVNEEPFDHSVLDPGHSVWPEIISAFGADLHKKACAQLGTVGGGNHYVDLLVDEHGYVWVAVHFGSRGFGHTIASGFIARHHGMKFTERVQETDDPVLFATDSEIGEFYLHAMSLAGQYAYAGREHVVDKVMEILGAKPTLVVHNHHNFAWKENGLWVVRKGATPLTADPAFIGGSMGDDSYIVRGKTETIEYLQPREGHPALEGAEGLYDTLYNQVVDLGNIGSAPHGAGRQMSRNQAAGKMQWMWVCGTRGCDFEPVRSAKGSEKPEHEHRLLRSRVRDRSTAGVDWNAERSALLERGIVVLGADADESPPAYKRLDAVLGHHENVEVMHTLSPIGVVMAGPDIRDPYQD